MPLINHIYVILFSQQQPLYLFYLVRVRPSLSVDRNRLRVCPLWAVPIRLADWLEAKLKIAFQVGERGGRHPHPCRGIKSMDKKIIFILKTITISPLLVYTYTLDIQYVKNIKVKSSYFSI